ncbi:MAG: MFS transporter [Ancrocorticia sp.]|uniref:MFS transporter n=1 Tax=Ancrocorticia sp. TaxID=2593684 RepID=UPI003F939390
MASFIQSFKNTGYLQSSVNLLLFFMSWGIWWSFFQLWLKKDIAEGGLGFTNTQVGTVYSINSLATLVIMFAYGTLQDRLGYKRHIQVFIAAISALVGPFVIYVYEPLLHNNFMLGAILGSIVLSCGFMSGVGLLEALAERFSRRYNFEYGQARMWGSFGYALVALMAGFLFTINPHIDFWLGSLFGLANLMIVLFWKAPTPGAKAAKVEAESTQPGFREMASLLRMPALWIVIVIVFFSWTFYTVFDQQMFPDFYTSLFDTREAGERTYGVLNSVQVFAEAAMMGVVPLIMRKIGVHNTLLCGFAVMSLRILGCAVFADPVMISIVKMFHALEVPLCTLPIIRYFTLHFNPALSATLYLVGFQVSSQLGNVVLSPILGALNDAQGYQPTFFLISAVVACAGVFGFFTLKKDHEQVLGDPFIRDPKKVKGGVEPKPAAAPTQAPTVPHAPTQPAQDEDDTLK